jgi:small-conductance mechanosensitive channel
MLSFLDWEIITISTYKLTVGGVLGVLITLISTKVTLVLILKSTKKRAKRLKLDPGRFHSIFMIIKYLIWTFSILICINLIGVKIGVILAGGAALLVGIGFGLQNIFSDLVAGFVILLEGSIEIQDIVEVDGVIGRVTKITLRQTEVITQNDSTILVPNHKFTGENVINWSHNNDVSRFHVNVGVAYGTNTEIVLKVLMECMSSHPAILKSPHPFVRFNDFGDSSLDFQLYFWSRNVFGIENIKSDLRYKIDHRFRENKIQIPFPQRDLHVISNPNKTPINGI